MVRTVREDLAGGNRTSGPYPVEDERDVALRDATSVHLRPIRGDDWPLLLALYDRLSSESLRFRFFAQPDKDAGRASYLSHVDYDRRYALVAELNGAIVGVARWERLDERPSHAEVAFTVADELQGRGLGTSLFRHLAVLAAHRGIAVFEAEALKENERMLRLFERSGLPRTTRDQGNTLTIALTLAAPPPPPG